MRLNEFTEQPVDEGYYDLNSDLPGMEPIDFSSNPSFKELVTRYTQLVYQGHTSETDPEEDQEHDAIEQYVAKHFGEKGSAHLQKAGEVSYWGRDDGKGSGGHRGDNLGYASMPGGKFRTTKSGKMHGQDVKMMKNKIADRLGRHPEPALPEGVAEEGYGNHPSQRVDPRTGKKYVPPKSPLGQGVAEAGNNYHANRTGFAKPQGHRDDERHDLDVARPLIYGLKINGKIWQKDGNTVTFFTKERALAARNAILAKRPDVEIGLVQRPKD